MIPHVSDAVNFKHFNFVHGILELRADSLRNEFYFATTSISPIVQIITAISSGVARAAGARLQTHPARQSFR